MPRIFIALPLPDEVRQELSRQAGLLNRKNPGLRVVGPHAMHLTLKFVGDFPEAQVARMGEELDRVAAENCPLELALTGVGCFPSKKRARVVWAGIGGDVAGLEKLAAAVDRMCSCNGIPAEKRVFKSHVTLGRLKTPSVIDIEVDQAALAFSVREVILFKSELRKEGARYTVLHRSFLGSEGE